MRELILYDVIKEGFVVKSLIYMILLLVNKIVFYRLIRIDENFKEILIDFLFNISFFKLNNS